MSTAKRLKNQDKNNHTPEERRAIVEASKARHQSKRVPKAERNSKPFHPASEEMIAAGKRQIAFLLSLRDFALINAEFPQNVVFSANALKYLRTHAGQEMAREWASTHAEVINRLEEAFNTDEWSVEQSKSWDQQTSDTTSALAGVALREGRRIDRAQHSGATDN